MLRKALVLFGLLPLLSYGQLNLINQTYNNSSFGYFAPYDINLSGTNTYTIGNGSYSYTAGTKIHFPPTVQISTNSPSAQGNFHAMIGNQQLGSAFIIPSPNPDNVHLDPYDATHLLGVTKFSKVELGVDLPAAIEDRVNAFFLANSSLNKPGTNGYNSDFAAGTIINPYDAEHISVDAIFFKPSSPYANGIIRHGFYYKQVNDIINTSTGINQDWNIDESNSYHKWRIRFAPDELGLWTGYINIYVGNKLLLENFFFSFTVTSSTKQGFIQKGPNPRYLQYSGNNQTYIPVGNNYGWTRNTEHVSSLCTTENCNGYTSDHRIVGDAEYELSNFLNTLTQDNTGTNTTNGANTTRTLMTPWGFQIEFEKLGNYDTRQIEMHVFDNYINMLEEKRVNLILGQHTEDLTYGGTPDGYTGTWENNPYNGTNNTSKNYPFCLYKGITGITEPKDFFDPTNPAFPIVLKFQKNRWRYIESRWGYSTAISMYEIFQEVDQQYNKTTVYWTTPNMETNVANFCNTIAQYLKEDLGTKHLTTVSYTGLSENDYFMSPGSTYISQSWSKPYIDVVFAHRYMEREKAQRIEYANTATLAVAQYPTKPCMYGEMDTDYFDVITLCTDRQLHNNTWASIFTGSCGPGLPWEQRRFNLKYWTDPDNSRGDNYTAISKPQLNQNYGPFVTSSAPLDPFYGLYYGEYEKNYPGFRTFLSQIDFQNHSYSSKSDLQPLPSTSSYFEDFYLISDDMKNSYGWAHNRSFNMYNNSSPCLNNNNPAPTSLYPAAGYTNMNDYLTNPHPQDDDGTKYIGKNAPQNPAGTFCTDANQYEDYYINAFGSGYNPVGLPATDIVISGILPNSQYSIQWYWTWGAQNGSAYGTPTTLTSSSANLTIQVPPTGLNGGIIYPGDWAFSINYLGAARMIGPGSSASNSSEGYDLQITPNPSLGIFTLNISNDELKEIAVYDIMGKIVYTEVETREKSVVIDISQQPKGVYFIKVISGNTTQTKKIIYQ